MPGGRRGDLLPARDRRRWSYGDQNWSTVAQGVTPSYFGTCATGRWRWAASSPSATRRRPAAWRARADGGRSAVRRRARIRSAPWSASRTCPFASSACWRRRGRPPGGRTRTTSSSSRSRPPSAACWAPSSSARVDMIFASAASSEDIARGRASRSPRLLRQRHRIQPGQEDDFTVRNLTEIAKASESASQVMTNLLLSVASISLLVGGIGIMNILLVSVTERTREIGIRMAVGAKSRHILLQFLVEAVMLSMVGGIVGVAARRRRRATDLVPRRLADAPVAAGGRRLLPVLRRRRRLLRLLSGPQGVAPRSDRGAALRVSGPEKATTKSSCASRAHRLGKRASRRAVRPIPCGLGRSLRLPSLHQPALSPIVTSYTRLRPPRGIGAARRRDG